MPSARTRWTVGTTVTVSMVAVGLAAIVLVRWGPLTGPWAYGALALAGLGAVGTTLLFVARAHGVDDG